MHRLEASAKAAAGLLREPPLWAMVFVLWEPTPVGDGLQDVCYAHRPQGGLLQKHTLCMLHKTSVGWIYRRSDVGARVGAKETGAQGVTGPPEPASTVWACTRWIFYTPSLMGVFKFSKAP